MGLFDRANQHANVWVKDMMAALGTDDPRKGLHALRAGLHALRDRLSVDEAAQLSAQLPLLVRGIFFEGWHPSGKPLRIRRKADFLALVREKYAPRTDAAADDIVTGLFRVLGRHVTDGEITNVLLSLPEELIEVAEGRPVERAEDR
jgi:uncharacterized protein (DUF2267 family)